MMRPEDVARRGAGSFNVVDNPILPWPPSDEILELKRTVAGFSTAEPFDFGEPYPPISFITALLLKYHSNEFPRVYEEGTFRVSEETSPVRLLNNVPILLPRDKNKSTFATAENVLINQAYEKLAGVILSGPLTGVVLQSGTTTLEKGLVIRRLWRDDKISSYSSLPDPQHTRLLSRRPQVIAEFEEGFRGIVDLTKRSLEKEDFWLSEFLKYLCLLTEIHSVDSKFHTSHFPEMV